MKKPFDKPTSSKSTDEEFFSQYLLGQSDLSEIYQTSDKPTPSAELDKKILTAASNAIHKTNKKWWVQPSSWAASIALFSLVGLITINTWQAEQKRSDEAMIPQATFEAASDADISPSLARQKQSKPKAKVEKISIDTRKLRFDAKPMPKMQAAPKSFSNYQKRSQFNTASDLSETSIQSIIISEKKVLSQKKRNNSLKTERREAEQRLAEIRQFINNEQLDKARDSLQQLQKKYPNYPIDPIILQHLSPP